MLLVLVSFESFNS